MWGKVKQLDIQNSSRLLFLSTKFKSKTKPKQHSQKNEASSICEILFSSLSLVCWYKVFHLSTSFLVLEELSALWQANNLI